MVRINLIDPRTLADQHLIAEYNEMLMLCGYVRKYPKVEGIPKRYCLGPGHIKFFKNKLRYIKKRHELLKEEMVRRGFNPEKIISLQEFPKELDNDWMPESEDIRLIKKRLIEKIEMKPEFYRYEGEYRGKEFFITLIEDAN